MACASCYIHSVETEARYPGVKREAGHYESFYVKAAAPGGGRAFWIRHTVHKRPGRQPTGSVWFTFFDRGRGMAPVATKITVDNDRLAVPPGGWIRVADAELTPGHMVGEVRAGGTEASWELGFDASGAPCQYLPAKWMYSSPLPRTKPLAPVPSTLFSGRLEVNGVEINLDEWPGMVGHNWGSEHAERWVWLEGTGFEGSDGDYFDCTAGRIKVAGRTLPWIASGILHLDGREYRLGGPLKVRGTKIDARPGSCDFLLPGREATVRGRLSAPKDQFVGWVYADPDGTEHNTINCSACDLELTVIRSGQKARILALQGAGAFELGMRETDHGIPIQPYGDG